MVHSCTTVPGWRPGMKVSVMTGLIRHKAGWIMAGPGNWIENGWVDIQESRIIGIGRGGVVKAHDHGPGVIMPPLVNAHTHISLSALAGLATSKMNFVSWVKALIAERAKISPETALGAAKDSVQVMHATGTGLVAEVGPPEPGATALGSMDMEGLVLVEVLGNVPELPPLPANESNLAFCYAGHGLHTTAPEILRAISSAARDRCQPFSIHLAESEAETEFLATGQGVWAELLESRGIDFSKWGLINERPVVRAERLGLLGPGTLAVHLLNITAEDIRILAGTHTSVCVCPRSNLTLHDRLPDLKKMLSAGLNVVLGTDSLASAPTLSLFDEMAFIFQHYPELAPETVLSMATAGGAQVLGRLDFGHLWPGRLGRLIYVDLSVGPAALAAETLVSKQIQKVEWL